MSSVLDHYNDYKTNSNLEWEGLKSNRFGRTKYLIPSKDVISPGLQFPDQRITRGKKYISQQNSPQKQFRSILKITPKIQHWHLRESKKRMVDKSLTQPHPRRQKDHTIPDFMHVDRSAGIRTFYNTQIREKNVHEYAVQDRMQRKHRVDQNVLRKTFFSKEGNRTFF